jgi:hypothetical protein
MVLQPLHGHPTESETTDEFENCKNWGDSVWKVKGYPPENWVGYAAYLGKARE